LGAKLCKNPRETDCTRTHTALCTPSTRRIFVGCVYFYPFMHGPHEKNQAAWTSSKSAQDSRRASPSEQRTTWGSPHHATQRHPAAKTERFVLQRSSLAVDIPSPLAQAQHGLLRQVR
jgi:hypothetical protein